MVSLFPPAPMKKNDKRTIGQKKTEIIDICDMTHVGCIQAVVSN